MIYELSSKYPVLVLCKEMNIVRSGYYKWFSRRFNPSDREIKRKIACIIFQYYHDKYPSHGYRWLNAKIRLDIIQKNFDFWHYLENYDISYSDNYAHKICKYLGLKSQSKHVKRYGKVVNRELKNFPNYILAELNPLRPFQIVVSDMTAFWANKKYYELTLFMDLFNNEIIAYSLSNKKGDPNSYHLGLARLISKKEESYKDLELIFHSDQGSVYSSKKFNESLPFYNIIHSMSKPGSPTENGAMEAINGWIKEELFIDFNINSSNDIFSEIENYISYFNNQRPQAALNYLTPIQFKHLYYNKDD